MLHTKCAPSLHGIGSGLSLWWVLWSHFAASLRIVTTSGRQDSIFIKYIGPLWQICGECGVVFVAASVPWVLAFMCECSLFCVFLSLLYYFGCADICLALQTMLSFRTLPKTRASTWSMAVSCCSRWSSCLVCLYLLFFTLSSIIWGFFLFVFLHPS